MKPIRLLAGIAGLALLLGACSSASGESGHGRGTSSTSTTAPASAPASHDATVVISAKGFDPYWADVPLHSSVTFENHTTTPQQIVFDNARDANGAPLQSPSIQPGATWAWTADTFASFAYHSPQLTGPGGRIQVDPPAEP